MSASTLISPEETKRRLASVYAPISAELAEVERIYARELASHYPFVQRLVDRAAAFGGKRLRPVLVLLTAQACGGVRPAHPVLAAVVEMIHTATLVHDDILDESEVRRHSATVNASWGNEPAVLLGDYLFSHAYHLAASLETTYACRLIGHATNLVCEGEMMQVHHRGNLDLDEAAYLAIVRGKTAELTAVSCRLGAHYARATEVVSAALDEYGRDLGVAFQIADDVLDLWGDERAAGKTLGTDLEKQKLTLPIIRMLATASTESAARVRGLLAHPRPESRRELRPALEASGALDAAWEQAERFARSARARLDCLPESPARDLLVQLTRHVVRRAV
jgi:octaprenyl-diphosphate synthase